MMMNQTVSPSQQTSTEDKKKKNQAKVILMIESIHFSVCNKFKRK